MRYTLNYSYGIKKLSCQNYIIDSTLDKQFEVTLDQQSINLLSIFSSPHSIKEVIELFKEQLDKNEIIYIIEWAISEKILVECFEDKIIDNNYNEIYDRRIRLF